MSNKKIIENHPITICAAIPKRTHTWLVVVCLWITISAVCLYAQQPVGYRLEPFIPNNLTAKAGDTVFIPLLIRNVSPPAAQVITDSCNFFFRFNPTVLLPLRREVFQSLNYRPNLAEGVITVRVNRRLRQMGDTILRIPMLVMLGDVETTEISIDGALSGYPFQVAINGQPYFTIPVTDPASGLLRVTNARWNSLLRTVNTNIGQLSLNISPIPLQNFARIEVAIGNLEPPPILGVPTIVFYAATGRDIPSLGLQEMVNANLKDKSSATFTIPIPRTLPRGVYYVRFAYGGFSVTRMVVVE